MPHPPGSPPDAAEAWDRWEPSGASPWGRKWAGHLLRRAAFAPTWDEVREALDDGPAAAVDRLLAGGEGLEDYDRVMDDLAPEPQGYGPAQPEDGRLPSWWLNRMIRTPHPLRERLVLFWHDHFATSVLKVRQPALMARQNITIRAHALGKFGPMIREMARDPAMLLWLDSASNVRGRPNENFARELMELFTLGVGHYHEADVREAARAFTGWQAQGSKFALNRAQHDDGPKTVLGKSGPLDGDDVLAILLDRPETARHLVRKVYRAFISDAEPPADALIDPLADRYRASGYDTADLIGVVLRSRLFFSDRAYRQRIKGPAEYVVGLLRSLEAKPVEARQNNMGMGRQDASLARAMDGLGQTLFAPPTVKGWAGGEAWLNSATILARHNLAWHVVEGQQAPLGYRVAPAPLARKHGARKGAEGQVDFFLDLLLQPGEGDLDPRRKRLLVDYLGAAVPPSEDRLRETIHAILTMPEYQLA